MRIIDWRELYAANRATIDAAQHDVSPEPGNRAGAPSRLAGLVGIRERGAALTLPTHVDVPPGASGTWERCADARVGGREAPYFVYTPLNLRTDDGPALVVMLHGCTQTADALARSTRMNAAADRHGFLVAYPEQAHADNPQRCWNWFLPSHQTRGAGEAAIVAGITRNALARLSGDGLGRGRAYLAGMSAGGAMAAVVAATYPELFNAVGIHSGLAYAAATSQHAALAALSRGAADPKAMGGAVHRAMGPHARIMPTMVVHGTADRVVAPINGDQLVEQWLMANHLAAPYDFDGKLGSPVEVARGQVEGGHRFTSSRWADRQGRPVLEYLQVDGLGHAWSGGSAAVAYSDPGGPDASEAIWDFFVRSSGSERG